jgi:transposase
MSLYLQEPPSAPEETSRVAQAAFPKGNLCLHIAAVLGPIYKDDQFAALFPRRGQPAEAPGRLALVTVNCNMLKACPIGRPPMPCADGSTGSMRLAFP